MVRFSKFEILNRSTQKVTTNYQSAKIFKTVCDRRSRGRVFIPYCPGVKKISLFYFDSLEVKWERIYKGELEDGNDIQILNFNKTFPVRQIILKVFPFHGSSDAGICATTNINS